jgi:serine/threonine protein kinase/tetratricopeptide (TPR) repeat protein
MTEPSLPEESIFAQAVEIGSAAERAAFLDRACGNNVALRAEVESLLRAHDRSGDILDLSENGQPTTELPAHERPGTVIGPYKLLEIIGEGGMGEVWMAEQMEPIQRRVAVKVIKEGMDSKQVLARFEAERQALALMEHPNIAKVLDAGRTPSGRPYFVMELVKGQPITNYCDEKRLAVRQRLELFGDVCRAVQHAHQKGIIHRDLKPSNVLVAPFDGKPVVKVIDFGVVKATSQRLTNKTLFTGFGTLVGTPEYMSPEQAEVNNQDIDTRSDIYSLGVLLYELLTGSTPLTRQRIEQAALDEVLRVIREEEPPKPSTRLSTTEELPSIAANRGLEPKKLSGLVRGELDWIVMKALEKDRNRRYETATGFALDIQRYLASEPVQACPPSATYRFRKFVRRNKAVLLTAGLFAVALLIAVVALTVSTVLTSRAYDAERTAHDRAEANFQRARGAVHDFFTTVSQSKLLDVPGVQPVRQELLEFAARYYQGLAKERDDDPTIQADLALAHLRLAGVYYDVGKSNETLASIDAGLDVAEPLIQNHPDDRDLQRRLAGFWNGTRRMAGSIPGPDNVAAAERTLNRLNRVWTRLANNHPSDRAFRSDLAITYESLGQLYEVTRRYAEAMVASEKALMIWDGLVRDYPNESEYLNAQSVNCSSLAYLARMTGQHERESEYGRKAFEATKKLAAANPTAPPYRELIANRIMEQAGALRAQKKPVEAEQQLRQALAIWEKLATEYPLNVRYRTQLLATCGNLAVLQKSLGQTDDAERLQLRFAEILDNIMVNLPAEPEAKARLADVLRQTALEMEEPNSREILFRRAIFSYEKVLASSPDNATYLLRLAWLHADLGKLLKEQPGLQRDTEKHLREAATLVEKLASDSPTNSEYRQQLVDRHNDLIGFLRATGQQQETARVYQWDVNFYEKLTGRFPDNSAYQWALAQARGQLHINLGEWDKAIADCSKAIDLDPNHWEAWSFRGYAHLFSRHWEKSIQDYNRAIELAPDVHTNWLHRGLAYSELGQWDKMVADFSNLLKRYPDDYDALRTRAVGYMKLNQPDLAVADLRQAIAKGYKDLEGIRNDDRFAPLRTRDDFIKLLAEAEQKLEKKEQSK